MMADATGKVVGVKIDHRALAGCPVLPLLDYELYGLVSFFSQTIGKLTKHMFGPHIYPCIN